MAKRVKGVYRAAAWFFSTVIAAGTFTGCGGAGASKYGPPVCKYGAPSAIYNQKDEAKKQAATMEKSKSKISEKADETHI